MRCTAIATLALFTATAGHAQAPDWRSARPIEVDLSSFKFTPSTLTLEHGVAYRLHLANTASGGHDFAAEQFFANSEIAPEDRAKVENGRVELDGDASTDILLVPLKAGTYRVHCTHFMHSAFGMKGEITVR